MGKKKHQKSRRRETETQDPNSVPPTLEQQVLTGMIARLTWQLTLTPFLSFAYIAFRHSEVNEETTKVISISLFIYLAVTAAKPFLNAKCRELYRESHTNQSTHLRVRRYMVWLLTMSVGENIAFLIPILHMRGYITRLAALLPGKEQISNELSLAIAFVSGAIVSGVLGNASYDVLKLIVQRMVKKKAEKQ